MPSFELHHAILWALSNGDEISWPPNIPLNDSLDDEDNYKKAAARYKANINENHPVYDLWLGSRFDELENALKKFTNARSELVRHFIADMSPESMVAINNFFHPTVLWVKGFDFNRHKQFWHHRFQVLKDSLQNVVTLKQLEEAMDKYVDVWPGLDHKAIQQEPKKSEPRKTFSSLEKKKLELPEQELPVGTPSMKQSPQISRVIDQHK